MRRVISYAVLVVSLAVAGVAIPTPASATTRTDGLLGPVGPLPAEASVWSRDGVLKKGRQTHAYRYRVVTGEAYWSLELFLLDPKKHRIASSFQTSGADARNGRGLFRFWSQGTRAGRFTIKAKLTWGDYDRAERWLAPRTFRLRSR